MHACVIPDRGTVWSGIRFYNYVCIVVRMRDPSPLVWGSLTLAPMTRRMQRIVGERERGTVHGGRIRLLPPEINWAHRMLSQSSASSLLCWSCTHWLKCVASVTSDVPLMGSHIEGGGLGFN